MGRKGRAATVHVMSTGRSLCKPCLLDGFSLRHAVADPVSDGTDEHQAFEHRRSCEGDEADTHRDGKRQPHNPRAQDTTHAGEEDAAENHQGVSNQ